MNKTLLWTIIGSVAAVLALIPAFSKDEKDVQQTSIVQGNNNTVNQFIQPPTNAPALPPPVINNISITNQNYAPTQDVAAFIARQSALIENKKRDAEDYKYQADAWKATAQAWQVAYINLVAPNAILMLGDLAQLRQFSFSESWFIERWSVRIENTEQRIYCVEEILIKCGWASSYNGRFFITEDGVYLLQRNKLFPFGV
jgi:hypothetical protein